MTEQQIIQSKMVMESPDTFMLRGAIQKWSGLIFHHVCMSSCKRRKVLESDFCLRTKMQNKIVEKNVCKFMKNRENL